LRGPQSALYGSDAMGGVINIITRKGEAAPHGSSPRAEDQGQAMLLHPALERDYPAARRIVIPEQLTICGGPMLPAALDRLSDAMARISR
ncbi:hypothetical protein GGD83_004869, partial [Rhodoblastus sphagnicola]|nr:hypothetical protein [Rhodoblastus sphagnicola]